MRAAAIEQSLFRCSAIRKQTGQNRTERTTDTVYRHRANRVVDLGDFIKKFHREHDYDTEHDAHNRSTNRCYRVTACGNADQSRKRGVVSHRNIRLLITDPGKDQGHAASDRRRQIRVEEHTPRRNQQLVAVHAKRRRAVKAEPAKPQDEHAQCRKGQVVSENRARFAIFIVFADTRSEDLRANESTDAADHMYCRGTREIVETEGGKPAAAPDPVTGDWINQK